MSPLKIKETIMHYRFLAIFALISSTLFGQTVRFATNLGDIDVVLMPEFAPRTVANFLNYVNRGAYNNSFIHRSVPGFVIQGGGYVWQNTSPNVVEIPSDPPVVNEYRVSNTRGTIAMAKLGSGPNTATNQWFFNLADNSRNLDSQNGGFTVFGRIVNGLSVMDRIAALRVYDAGSPFDSLPLQNYTSGTIQERHLVIVTSITVLNSPSIAPNGIATASSFGRYSYGSPGTYIEIYGSNFAPDAGRAWAGSDFNGINAPASLDGISVTVNGVPAFVSYIGANQINVQIPAGVPTGGNVPIVVTNRGAASPAVQFPIREAAAGMLAPATFRAGDKQYVYAEHADGRVVSNGEFADLPAAPAVPGETLTFYGIGFGPVTPATPSFAGQIAQGQSRLNAPIEFKFGSFPGRITYAGLAPNLVGLYQFNVTVPAGVEEGDVPLTVTLESDAVPQTLLVPVKK